MLPKLKRYNKKLEYAYSFGVYPTLDLLKYKLSDVIEVLVHSHGMDSDGVNKVQDICDSNNIPFRTEDNVINKLAFKENTYVIGVFNKFKTDLSKDSNHIVLDRPRNMGNVGTIIRTMVGFGFKDLAIIRPAADVYDPKVVRSAMGGLFQINVEYFDTYEEYVNKFKGHSQNLFVLEGSKKISEVEFTNPYSLVFGNESEGIDMELVKHGVGVYIPHSKEIDSLNLSIAASVAMYEVSKDNFK